MKLTENRRRILKTIEQAPREARHFTHGIIGVTHPDTVRAYLDEMEENGLVYQADRQYHITALGQGALKDSKPAEKATMRQNDWRASTYRIGDGDNIGAMVQREGSDHKHILSVGVKC